jgi:hypothetical protein
VTLFFFFFFLLLESIGRMRRRAIPGAPLPLFPDGGLQRGGLLKKSAEILNFQGNESLVKTRPERRCREAASARVVWVVHHQGMVPAHRDGKLGGEGAPPLGCCRTWPGKYSPKSGCEVKDKGLADGPRRDSGEILVLRRPAEAPDGVECQQEGELALREGGSPWGWAGGRVWPTDVHPGLFEEPGVLCWEDAKEGFTPGDGQCHEGVCKLEW